MTRQSTREPGVDDVWPTIEMTAFEKLATRRRKDTSRQHQALHNLPAGKAIIMDHAPYKCKNGTSAGCALTHLVHRVAHKRSLAAATKHLADGKLAVAFYA